MRFEDLAVRLVAVEAKLATLTGTSVNTDNALNINAQTPKEPESAMYQSLNGTNVPMSPADNHRIGSSQSAPHLSKTTSNTKNLIQSREGTAGITAGAATTTMISTATTNGGMNRINIKTN